jgi:hypothetical protein
MVTLPDGEIQTVEGYFRSDFRLGLRALNETVQPSQIFSARMGNRTRIKLDWFGVLHRFSSGREHRRCSRMAPVIPDVPSIKPLTRYPSNYKDSSGFDFRLD